MARESFRPGLAALIMARSTSSGTPSDLSRLSSVAETSQVQVDRCSLAIITSAARPDLTIVKTSSWLRVGLASCDCWRVFAAAGIFAVQQQGTRKISKRQLIRRISRRLLVYMQSDRCLEQQMQYHLLR